MAPLLRELVAAAAGCGGWYGGAACASTAATWTPRGQTPYCRVLLHSWVIVQSAGRLAKGAEEGSPVEARCDGGGRTMVFRYSS